MSIQQSHHYDADAGRVFELMTDEGFLRDKYAAFGHEGFEVLEHSIDGDRVTVRTKRVVPANVPAFARKFISPRSTVVQTERWEGPPAGARHGTWTIEVEGAPVSISGTMSLDPDAGGCRHVIHGEVKVSIPLVGGKIARFVEDDSVKSVADEVAFTRRRLESA